MKTESRSGMIICNDEVPPNYQEVKKFLPAIHDKIIYTWGNTIYNPAGFNIDPGLMRHEMKHSEQQADYGWLLVPFRYKISRWWHRYLRDRAFRLSQELPAYQLQFQTYAMAIKDKNKLKRVAVALAKDLSGPIYGGMLSLDQAVKAIQNPKIYEFRVK